MLKGSAMDDSSRILVQIAADETAIWLPNRSWCDRKSANVYMARQEYVASGVPWESGGGDEATRKERQRVLEGLARTGLVQVFRPHRIKTLTVKLSDAAREQARMLAGQPGELAAWWSMLELAKHSKRPARLIRGWVVSNSDIQGHVYYGLTESGWTRLDGPEPADDAARKVCPKAAEWFTERLGVSLAKLDTMTNPREIGPLPLPVSMAEIPLSQAWAPGV